MATAAAAKRTAEIDEIINSGRVKQAPTAKKVEAEQDSAAANIKENPFYQVIFDAKLTPEEKKAAVAKIWVSTGDKAKDRANAKDFEAFKEYLQHMREEMAVKIIKLTDTDTFSELKQVYEDLNNALIDFDDKMNPLTEIIDSIYTLRTNGVAFDAFKEIQQDKAAEEAREAERANLKNELDSTTEDINNLNYEINSLRNQRSLFGFGGVKKEALDAIARKEVELQNLRNSITDLETKIQNTNGESTPSQLGEFAAQKEKLRELLDITSDEHKQRQADLVNAALNFVKTSKERVGSVKDHLGKMNNQVENLGDANGTMTRVYAIMNEGLKEAEKINQANRDKLMPPETEEDLITKMTREEKKAAIEDHLTALNRSSADTIVTYGDLVSQSTRIKTMKDANDVQITKASNMYTQGVAGVADRLSVVLQAVSAAALGESSSMAGETLARMSGNTNKVAQKESIRIAMGISDQNNDIAKAIEDLATYGEVTKAATNITREGITEMRSKLEEMERIAGEVRKDVADAVAVTADVALGLKKPAEKAKVVADDEENPFKL
jgi:hypothetical protein